MANISGQGMQPAAKRHKIEGGWEEVGVKTEGGWQEIPSAKEEEWEEALPAAQAVTLHQVQDIDSGFCFGALMMCCSSSLEHEFQNNDKIAVFPIH